jgi:hypothetical protein
METNATNGPMRMKQLLWEEWGNIGRASNSSIPEIIAAVR